MKSDSVDNNPIIDLGRKPKGPTRRPTPYPTKYPTKLVRIINL